MGWRALPEPADLGCASESEILSRDPDIIVLSEAPARDGSNSSSDDLGTGADCVGIQHDPGAVTGSAWWSAHDGRSELDERHAFPGGVGMSVTAEVRGRPIRILAVDGQSNPFRSRLPFLRAIAEPAARRPRDGRPFDIVAGDFNTPSRSLGFDDLVGQGYRFASQSARGWRNLSRMVARLRYRSCLGGHGCRVSWCSFSTDRPRIIEDRLSEFLRIKSPIRASVP